MTGPNHSAFEWDEAKRRKNIEKHGIDFVDAALVLLDLTVDVPSGYAMEPRRKATGYWDGKLITVVYTLREGKTRIISARRAWANEQRAYRELYG